MKTVLSFWQFVGFVFTSVFGTVLHFLYNWTGKSILIAPFSAVNESIWEHMKLLYFPMLIFAFFQSRFFKSQYKNFWCAKLFGFLTGLILIPVLYYSYTGILGISADWFNILIFFIAAAMAYIVETNILKNNKRCLLPSNTSLGIIIVIGIIFVIFTFVPIKIPLFKDPITGTYGVI